MRVRLEDREAQTRRIRAEAVAVRAGAQLQVTHLNGFTANVGDTFNIINVGGTATGNFSTIIPPSGLEAYTSATLGKNVFLQRGTLFTGVNVWNTDSSGDWGTAANWTGGVPK